MKSMGKAISLAAPFAAILYLAASAAESGGVPSLGPLYARHIKLPHAIYLGLRNDWSQRR